MAAPTGKLKHAYQTISNMESIIEKQKAQIKKVIVTQEKHCGDGTGLHLAMIGLIKELKNDQL
tara:strand:- start:1188 stop:1376 length:189 start_codon:yes stop_codon:yes gene_type:complete